VEAGKLADLLVAHGNPLIDITVLRQPPAAVFLGGRLVS